MLRALPVAALALSIVACDNAEKTEAPAAATATEVATVAESPDDPYLWLEGVEDPRALDWARERNTRTVAALAESEGFKTLESRILANLDSTARIPGAYEQGGYLYNFWRDAANPRGLWRRTTLEEYRKDEPAWDVVIDLDALGKTEDENWVWRGADCLRPDYQRCLISLSRGGADATVVREFDLEARRFVEGGFFLPEAKGSMGWIDLDTVFVQTDFGPGSMTDSGYPRIAKRWSRGTPLESAEIVHEGKAEDVWISAYRDDTPGFEREAVNVGTTFWTSEVFLLKDGEKVRFDKPDDANLGWHREWLMLELRSDWTIGERTWPAGALLVTRFDDFLAGKRDFEMLFEPAPTKSLAGWSATRNHVLVNELDNVRNRIYVATHGPDGWTREPLAGAPEFGTVGVSPFDPDTGDDYWMTVSDYLTPSTLSLGSIGSDTPEKLKSLPAFFDATGLTVAQHFATSDDGTRIPYFIVYREGLALDGRNPTLLFGYGGFEVSMLPGYNATAGVAWLEKGGVFVVANIRGGGEFGPKWHQAALKENRNKAFEDFAAVARDLIGRQITSPAHLGVQGGSNGGLLTGNMLTMYPELFGAIVIQVPLLDMRRYHTLLAGASWMGEYGNPDDPAEWAFLERYSPYHNVKADAKYPPVLITTSTRDDRVHPGHARKMTALLESQGHPVYYYENIEGGHGGSANNQQAAFMQSLAWTFLWDKLAPKD
jgi:prolyl oligopeptidase